MPLTLLAALVISGASVDRTPDAAVLRVTTSERPDPAGVSAALADDRVRVVFRDGSLQLAEERFGEGARAVTVRRVPGEGVVAEWAAGSTGGCGAPQIATDDFGVSVRIDCRAAGAGGPAGIATGAAASAGTVALPAMLVLVALAAAAVALRRRRPGGGLVEVLETASLGPRRALIVARVGHDRLVLGSSEAGITLLSLQAGALPAAPAHAPLHLPASHPQVPSRPSPPAEPAGLLARIGLSRAPVPAFTFAAALEESTEDLELARKLALARGRP